jgi:5-carboxymethyl-2-hydroxymuconate isomerase
MPHLTLEYTDNLKNLDPADTLLALNHALVASGHFEEADIKSRAIPLQTWLVGTSSTQRAFVHVKLAILSGRSASVKSELSGALLRVLRVAGNDTAGCQVQLCVEVLDIDRASYAKEITHA